VINEGQSLLKHLEAKKVRAIRGKSGSIKYLSRPLTQKKTGGANTIAFVGPTKCHKKCGGTENSVT
jgi:hypothetical protein